MKTGVDLIAEEQKRKREKFGYNVNDIELQHYYENGELLSAADAYLAGMSSFWPSNWEHPYKPTPENRLLELQKAGAFIADEIERLQRLEQEKTV